MRKIIDTVTTVERNEIFNSTSTRAYGRLRLRLDQEIPVLPGQFAMIKPHRGYEPLLRRAMAYYQSEIINHSLSVEFIYLILGRGTQMLAELKAGDQVDLLGSLGNTFDTNAARGHEALLVAGGVGSTALYLLARDFVKLGIPVRLFIGGASQGDLCGLDDFTEILSKERVHASTIDGSYGEKGLVTSPLEKYLTDHQAEPAIIYACGPDPMLHRIAKIADYYAIPAQLSLEAPMACGFGVCVGCAVAVKDEGPEGYVYKKVCTDGTVFWSNELSW
ncbi:MAG: dihydroorotate dehydrogenase electron transfer subunit [Acidobacteria bacterium]|nr:dihydroorotate dehydrogenase electron transfer subunit [Acidobacteriota bacterium]